MEELEGVQDLLLEELRTALAVREHFRREIFHQTQLVAAVAVVDRLGRAPAEIEDAPQRAVVATSATRVAYIALHDELEGGVLRARFVDIGKHRPAYSAPGGRRRAVARRGKARARA